ncbi:tryptophan 2,3-dioxygenase family protein [Streptomyces hygroscopicus]|uniref:tryptophan 2,3-dioxygenase family protein n=1 Tax=Streptomyces hygroscopicus TaxID=1912 RepID=UPI0009A097AC|nr:tryptophan 2,3-dioxygenase family protein [Streptomyces hygroscopicus]
MSQQPAPDRPAPAQATPDRTTSAEATPGRTTSAEVTPPEATSAEATPDRTASGAAESDAPHLDFDGTTPYEDYVRASVLTHLQHPLSDDPGEMVFLVTTQVMELWFTVIVHEWHTAALALREDDLPTAMAALQRSTYELESLNASWAPLAHLTPGQFNAYRSALGEGSGFQSAMYRQLEFLLGEKSASMLVPHRGAPQVHAELEKALTEPSLYDEVLRYLARRGLDVPASVLDRDPTRRYEPDPGVERVWEEIYSGPPDSELIRLGEALTEVAELVWRWRNDHLVATRRAMGAKTGTGGSAGVAWLEKRASKTVFPELWTARSHV